MLGRPAFPHHIVEQGRQDQTCIISIRRKDRLIRPGADREGPNIHP